MRHFPLACIVAVATSMAVKGIHMKLLLHPGTHANHRFQETSVQSYSPSSSAPISTHRVSAEYSRISSVSPEHVSCILEHAKDIACQTYKNAKDSLKEPREKGIAKAPEDAKKKQANLKRRTSSEITQPVSQGPKGPESVSQSQVKAPQLNGTAPQPYSPFFQPYIETFHLHLNHCYKDGILDIKCYWDLRRAFISKPFDIPQPSGENTTDITKAYVHALGEINGITKTLLHEIVENRNGSSESFSSHGARLKQKYSRFEDISSFGIHSWKDEPGFDQAEKLLQSVTKNIEDLQVFWRNVET
ncbi:hypothetical protein JCM33374_g5310 [Metschnikowia sp. JCM 33374]|nr:hypothetical protein JCM33374_g5310 [Metschnikowia sp. JCM 33374]